MFKQNRILLSITTASFFVVAFFTLLRHQQAIADFVFAGRNDVTAALTGVTLNNGNGNVITGSDVTSQTASLSPDAGAYRWTVSGSNYMVLNMPFDATSPQTDFSGNGNGGLVVSGAAYSAADCKVGGCMVFNGTSSYINAGSGPGTQFGGTNASFSLEAWIKRSAINHADFIINQGPAASNTSVQLGYRVTNEFTFGFYNNDLDTAPLIDTDGWHHWVGTYDGTTNDRKLYRDGVLAASDVSPADYTGTGDVILGAILAAPVYLGGSLDEVRIYARALSADQVVQNYTDGRGSVPYLTSTDGLGGPTTIQSEETAVGQVWDLSITPITTAGSIGLAIESSNPVLIVSGAPTITGTLDNPDEGSPIISSLTIPGGSIAGYRWVKNNAGLMALNIPFNSGVTQSDVSGAGNHGTTINAPTFTTSGCKVGNCETFDGTNDRIEIADAASLDITTALTIEAWVNPSISAVKELIDKNNATNTGPGAYQIFQNNQNISFRLVKGAVLSTMTTSTTISLGAWTHVVATWDGTTMRVYLNGVQDATTLALSSPIDATTGKLIIGAYADNQFAFNGKLDEVRIYPRALSRAQIIHNYQDGASSLGGPTRISAQEHVLGETWDLAATEFLSDGSVGAAGYIDGATITAAAATTLGITTPGTAQTGNVTINYSCSDTTSALRDLLVEYSTNGGGSFANATIVSTTSGSAAGSYLSMVSCASGTSNSSFVWNSITDGVGDIANAQIRITAAYPGGPSATTANFNIDNPTNLCTAGGEAAGGLTAAETSFDGTSVMISGCTLSIDGAHSFAGLTIGNGVGTADSTLTQTDTTASVVTRTTLTIAGATTINSDGLINLDGKGFVADRTSDGLGGTTITGASTDREGGSHGGRGGTDSVTDSSGVTYDSISQPVDPGGGPGADVGDGGGYIKLTTVGFAHGGTISANSVTGANGTGAGGGIWIIATGAITGSGTIRANGAIANTDDGSGAGGRIALHYNSSVSGNSSLGLVFQAFGGDNAGSTDRRGGAGTVYLEKTNQHVAGQGDVIIANNNLTVTATRLTPIPSGATFADVTIRDRAMAQASTFSLANLTLQSNGTLFHDFTTASTVFRLNVTATGTVSIDSTSSINLDGRGFVADRTSDGAGGTTATGASLDREGGSHGGRGGADSVGDSSGVTYDSITQPADPGGGPGAGVGAGGGYLKMTTVNLVNSGTITANGTAADNGSGAGGAIWIIATGQISGTGTIRANGVTANADDGSGAGGRIALHYNSALAGNDPLTPTFQVFGGDNAGSADFRGGAGTLYFEKTNIHAADQGDVVIGNNNVALTVTRLTPIPTTPSFANITIKDQAIAQASTFTVGNLTLQNVGRLQHDFTTTTTVYRLFITATGTISVDVTSTINVDGRGFTPTRTSDGAGGITTTGGSGDRSGGSHGGVGGSDSVGDEAGVTYDSISQPADPGAGAGGQSADGNGGGYIKISTGALTVNGTITANGQYSINGSGAGGGIWIIATGLVSGTGTIRANSVAANPDDGSGAGGRVALHYNSALVGNSPLTPVFQAFGGDNTGSTNFRGGAGTVYFEKTNIHAVDQGDVVIANNNVTITTPRYTPIPTTPAFASIIIKDRAVSQASTFTVGDLTMQTNSILQHAETTTATIFRLNITVTGTFSTDSTSSIAVDGRGFTPARTSNGLGGITTTGGTGDRSGGSHGGRGGSDSVGDDSGIMYDDFRTPTEPGGGAGSQSSDGDGGGHVKITTVNFAHSGTISANGQYSINGGGAGGGIWIVTTGSVSGSGIIRASGGTANTDDGSGGGGRIAFYYDGGIVGNDALTQVFQVFGGTNGGGSTRTGGAGTIYVKDSTLSFGDLEVNNNSIVTDLARATRLFVAVPSGLPIIHTFRDLSVINQARLVIDTPCAGTPALTVTGLTDLSNSGTITNNQSGTCTVTQGAISITTTTLPTATVNSAYSQAIASTGGYGPHTFVCRSGGITVACTTVLPAGLDMSSAGVVSGTPTVTGTTLFTVRATEASPGVGTDEETISITVGNAPAAPTSLFSGATDAQSCCSSAITDATPVFSAIFNDADVGNTGTKYRIQVASDAGFTTLLWNSNASGTAMTSTAIGARSPNINYGGSALTLGGVTYYWRIKFWDNSNLEGAFSATATFTTSTAPTAPTTLFSNDGSAQTGLTNPVGVTSGRPNFSAIFNDPDVGDIATKYRIQVDDNNNFSSVVWDSGAAGTSMANCNEGARCADIVFGAVAELDVDESVYFWRIKFFDQAGVESPWSQDPTSTNKFTMGAGGTSQQRIAEQQQQDQEEQEQESLPAAPQAVSVEVLGSTTLRFNWLDNSNNETGFRLLDANNAVIADVPAGTTSAQEINLAPNTQVTGRKVVAYNAIGQSSPSEFARAVTAAPQARPRLLGRTQHSVTFSIEPPFSSFPGDTAIMYEILVTRPRLGVSQLRLSSEWIKTNEYTFEGIEADDEIEVRVTTRNQTAISSEPTVYEEMEDLSRRFAVTLGVFKTGTNTLPRPLATNEVLTVSVQVQNVGSLAASNVLVSLPLPRYIVYRGGTLTVDGRNQSDGADQDAGQASGNAVSAIWGSMQPNETHTLRFELAFDEAALNLLRPQSTTETNQAQAAANPIINLQVAVSFAESEDVYMSPVVSLEPDVTTSEPIVTPEPEPIPEEPVPLPTPEEVEQINEFLNQIIQQEVEESGGDTGTTPPASQAPEPTTVSSDGPSFNVEVTNDAGESLSLTGLATANQDQIEFTGTTSQPFSIVMLIFNDSVTSIVVSDENGNWRTFVSADQLGIKPGQEASVKIEAIASKGDLRSERVQVGEVKISLGRSGDIKADFDTTVSSSNAVTVINELRKEVVRVIEEQQPVIQTTLSVTAPVVVVSSVPLWGYLPYVPTMIYHFITYLLGLIGRKKKGQQRFYGVVYDSITKQPLPLAIVRIYSLVIPNGGRKLVSTTVTDKLGRYEALLAPGKYTLEVTKPTYQFPSQIVTAEADANFHTHRAQDGMTIGEQGTEITVPDVPLDPVNAQRQWQLTGGVKKVWLSIQKVGNYLAVPVLLVGSIASVATVAAIPDKGVNWLLAIMYVLLLAAQLRLRPKIVKAWGVVYDIATNAVLPLTTIQLIDPQYGKVVASRLSDYEGRFSFLPEPGSYVIKATRAGFEQVDVVETPSSERQPMSNKVVIQKPDQAITGDVAMKSSEA